MQKEEGRWNMADARRKMEYGRWNTADGSSTRRSGTKKDERKCNNSNIISDLEIPNRLGGCCSKL